MDIKKIIEKKEFIKQYTGKNFRGINPPLCCFTLKEADIWIITEQVNGKELIHPCSKEWAIKQGWVKE
jgi:hypothetical protein